MNISVIDKILGFTFPEDIVFTIASYFIQKIPKKDKRFYNIKNLFISRHFFLKRGYIQMVVYIVKYSLGKNFIRKQISILQFIFVQ